MTTAAEFAERWLAGETEPIDGFYNKGLLRFDADKAASLGLGPADLAILVESGLPSEAAPGLTFGDSDGQQLKTIPQSIPLPPGDSWNDAFEWDSYRLIGDWDGDPVAIDVRSGSVVLMEHEWGFEKIVFMNSSVTKLVESLLVFREMMDDAHRCSGGVDPWSEDRLAAGPSHRCFERLATIDPPAMSPGAFWRFHFDEDRRAI